MNQKRYARNARKNSLIKNGSAPSFRLKGGGWYETDFQNWK